MEPHPLFRAFIGAAYEQRRKRPASRHAEKFEQVKEYSRGD
jgi:hypothetical protein